MNNILNIGVTGSRHGFATNSQKQRFKEFAEALTHMEMEAGAPVIHHGDCIGIDEEVFNYFCPIWQSHAYPPEVGTYRAYLDSTKIHLPQTYMVRNLYIVRACDILLAIPDGKEDERVRSGTWATIRLARKFNKPIKLIMP